MATLFSLPEKAFLTSGTFLRHIPIQWKVQSYPHTKPIIESPRLWGWKTSACDIANVAKGLEDWDQERLGSDFSWRRRVEARSYQKFSGHWKVLYATMSSASSLSHKRGELYSSLLHQDFQNASSSAKRGGVLNPKLRAAVCSFASLFISTTCRLRRCPALLLLRRPEPDKGCRSIDLPSHWGPSRISGTLIWAILTWIHRRQATIMSCFRNSFPQQTVSEQKITTALFCRKLS